MGMSGQVYSAILHIDQNFQFFKPHFNILNSFLICIIIFIITIIIMIIISIILSSSSVMIHHQWSNAGVPILVMAISYSLIFHHMRSSRLLLEVDHHHHHHHHHRHHYHLLRHHDNHDRHQHTDGFFRLDPPDPLRQKFKNIIMKPGVWCVGFQCSEEGTEFQSDACCHISQVVYVPYFSGRFVIFIR